MEKSNETKQQGVMLSTRTPWKLLVERVDSCLAEGREQSVNAEACLNVHKWKIRWGWGDVSKVEKSTSLDGDGFDILPS